MKKNFITAILFTIVTTVLFGVLYPLAVTGLAQALFRDKADGQLIKIDGRVVGSRIIGQNFNTTSYFHSRPSNAGAGYDASSSSGSNYGPTNRVLIDRVHGDVAKLRAENSTRTVPVDLVSASGSGLDPDISPAAAEFQIPRVALERKITPAELRVLVRAHTQGRQLGFLGEPRVNVLELNLDLDARHPLQQ